MEAGLHNVGEVDEVSILPLVERLTPDGSKLAGYGGWWLIAIGVRYPSLLLAAGGNIRCRAVPGRAICAYGLGLMALGQIGRPGYA